MSNNLNTVKLTDFPDTETLDLDSKDLLSNAGKGDEVNIKKWCKFSLRQGDNLRWDWSRMNIFKQDLFDFFANEHNITLLDGEMNDIIHFVHKHYPSELLLAEQAKNKKLVDILQKIVLDIIEYPEIQFDKPMTGDKIQAMDKHNLILKLIAIQEQSQQALNEVNK